MLNEDRKLRKVFSLRTRLHFVFVLGPACGNPSPLDQPPPAASPPLVEGAPTESIWLGRAMRATLDGSPMTEIRLLRDRTSLLVFVDAKDREVTKDDRVELAIGRVKLDLAPQDIAGADVGWTAKAAIPLDKLGPSPVSVRARRCDPACAEVQLTVVPDGVDRGSATR